MSMGLKPRQRWCLVSDDDGYDYVIPVEKRYEFHEIVHAINCYQWGSPACELTEPPPQMPSWAHLVEAALTFERPEVDGKEI